MDEMFDLFISGYISKFIAVCFCISMQKIAIRTSTYVSNSTNRFHGESKYAKKVQFLGKLPHYTIFASKGKIINIFEIFSTIAPIIKRPAVGGEKISKMLILAFKVIVKPPVYPFPYYYFFQKKF